MSSRGDHVTLEVVAGALTDPTSIVYVETRGAFEVARVEPWAGGRVLLVLRAGPTRT